MKSIRSFRKRQNNRSLSYRKSFKKFKKSYRIVRNRLVNIVRNLSKKSRS